MGVVLTLHKIEQFPEEINETIVAKEIVRMDEVDEEATTRFYRFEEEDFDEYNCYKIVHRQKYVIEAIKYNKPIQGVLRSINFSVFKKEEGNWLYTLSNAKGDYAVAALRRMKETTGVKTSKVEIDLIEAVSNIVKNDLGVKINSGWFSNLTGANLDNVLLQAEDVNNNHFWSVFRDTAGASLSNIELIIEDEDFTNNMVKISVSKRGYIHSRNNIRYEKMLELSNRIIEAIGEDTITKVQLER